jgi:hypothetical protein
MSVIIPATTGSGLQASSNLSSPQSFTKLIWAQFASTPTTLSDLIGAQNTAASTLAALVPVEFNSGKLSVSTGSGGGSDSFASQPTWTDWTCYALTGTTAGSGSLIGYWQDNAGGGFVSRSVTGVSFTNAFDNIGMNTMSVATTVAYYMEWNVVLTLTQLNAQFLSATPVITGASLSRYLPLAAATGAGADSSGNGFNMTINGSLTNGATLPTFPALSVPGAGPVPRTIFIMP